MSLKFTFNPFTATFDSIQNLSGLNNRVLTLENNEYKIVYFTTISAASGTITIPQGATILLDQFPNGVDAYVSQVDANGQPTGILPKTSLGVDVVVSSFDALGNYTLSGTPSSFPVALIYVLKIKAIDYNNLVVNNILEDERIDDEDKLLTWSSSRSFTQGQKFIWRSIFGDLRIYEVLPGQTLNAGETPFTNPEKVEMVTDWLDAGMVHRWHSSAIWWNFTKVLSFDNGAVNPGSSVTPVIGNGQTINSLGCRIQTAQTSGSTGRMSLYRIDSQIIGNAAYTATLIHDGGEFSTNTTGVKTVVITDTVLRKGELYLVLITNSNTSGSWQRMTFDLSFLGFNLTSGSITRYVHFLAQTLSSSGITDPTLPAQTNIRVLPASRALPTAFVR